MCGLTTHAVLRARWLRDPQAARESRGLDGRAGHRAKATTNEVGEGRRWFYPAVPCTRFRRPAYLVSRQSERAKWQGLAVGRPQWRSRPLRLSKADCERAKRWRGLLPHSPANFGCYSQWATGRQGYQEREHRGSCESPGERSSDEATVHSSARGRTGHRDPFLEALKVVRPARREVGSGPGQSLSGKVRYFQPAAWGFSRPIASHLQYWMQKQMLHSRLCPHHPILGPRRSCRGNHRHV